MLEMKTRSHLIAFFLLTFFITQTGTAQTNILVTYYSKTGNTQQMAEAVARGAASVYGTTVLLRSIGETTQEDLLQAHAIIVGSPVYNANVAPQVQEFISGWPFEDAPMKNKIGAAFVTAGGISAGEELTQMNILQSMLIYGMIVVGGPDWKSPFGASAIVNEPPFNNQEGIDPAFLKKGEELGRRVAEIALQMN
jgi:NAD(P)H dehydrogenase (quinone)